MVFDYQSPAYFAPKDCLKKFSFQLPKVTSPIIAVVGDSNEYQDAMVNYLTELFALQQDNIVVINAFLKDLYDGDDEGNTDLPEF